MSDEERPYRDHLYDEIMREKDLWERAYRDFSKAFRAAERVGARDDMDSARADMDRTFEEVRKCTRELELRRKARAEQRARREQRQCNRPQPSGAQSLADPTEGALACWFGRLNLEPQGVTTRAIDFSWQLQGRTYYAVYTSADRQLSVWLEVLPGTADAKTINNAPHLPANNPREIGRAFEAEKRVRRRPG